MNLKPVVGYFILKLEEKINQFEITISYSQVYLKSIYMCYRYVTKTNIRPTVFYTLC